VTPRTIAPGPGLLALFVTLLAGVALLVGDAAAQGPLRTTLTVGRTTPTHVEVTGTVANETRAEAVDVSVTVEAVGANGKSVARGVSYVTGRLPAGATANFAAKVPVVAGAVSYRASANSRFVQGIEGP
jgi:hypothetical protein